MLGRRMRVCVSVCMGRGALQQLCVMEGMVVLQLLLMLVLLVELLLALIDGRLRDAERVNRGCSVQHSQTRVRTRATTTAAATATTPR